MNIYWLLLIVFIIPLVFTAFFHISRLKLYKDVDYAKPFLHFNLPGHSQIIEFKEGRLPHSLVKGIDELSEEGQSETGILDQLSRINTYIVLLPKSYTLLKLEKYLMQHLSDANFKILFKTEYPRNNLKIWKRFFKSNIAERDLLSKSGFKAKNGFLYISAKKENLNEYLNFIGFHSGISRKRIVLFITLSVE